MAEVKVEDHSAEFLKLFDEKLETALEAIGAHIEGEAKELITNRKYNHKTGDPASRAYIDTGLLRNSIVYAVDGKEASQTETHADTGGGTVHYNGTAPTEKGGRAVYIGTNCEYAQFIHEGTSKIAPNRFLKDAVEMNKDQIKAKLEEATKGF